MVSKLIIKLDDEYDDEQEYEYDGRAVQRFKCLNHKLIVNLLVV